MAANTELARLRERAEHQARALETLERRLKELVNHGDISIVDVRYVGKWPQPAPARPAARARDPFAADGPLFDGPPAMKPYPGHACLSLRDGNVRVIGFALFGLSGRSLETTVEHVAGMQRDTMDFIPVFLTDFDDFAAFRRQGYVVEYFPPPSSASEPVGTRSAEEWRGERVELVRRKWGLLEIFNLGTRPAVAGG